MNRKDLRGRIEAHAERVSRTCADIGRHIPNTALNAKENTEQADCNKYNKAVLDNCIHVASCRDP